MAQHFKSIIEIEMLTLDEEPYTAEELYEMLVNSVQDYIREEFDGYMPDNFSTKLGNFSVEVIKS